MIQNKLLSEITWADIEHLCTSATPEGPTLEFKSGYCLETHPKNPKPVNEEKRREETRDLVGPEIVAFANAYGGTLIIGVEEADKEPKPAVSVVPVTSIHERVEALEKAVKAKIEPPIAGLTFRAILQNGKESEGAIVIRVPQSPSAPHGFGSPAACYIRDQGIKRPMGMREIQSVFWDARTRGERVKELRAEEQQRLDRQTAEWEALPLSVSTGMVGVNFRLSAIAHERLNFRSIPIDRFSDLRPSVGIGCLQGDDEGFGRRLRPMANGLWIIEGTRLHWCLTHDGVISVVGFNEAWSPSPISGNGKGVQPLRYAGTALQILIMMERLRRTLGYSALPFEFDCELRARKTVGALSYDGRSVIEDSQLPPVSRIGPFAVVAPTDIEPVFLEIRLSVFNAFGVEQSPHPTGNVKIADVIAQRWP